MLLLYISFLHQTTTMRTKRSRGPGLLYISFLHQTTTELPLNPRWRHCFISLFYIKPQLREVLPREHLIALYLFSTSNHNFRAEGEAQTTIALYLFSTSNHNLRGIVVLSVGLLYISFLHQTTTYTLYFILFQSLTLQ